MWGIFRIFKRIGAKCKYLGVKMKIQKLKLDDCEFKKIWVKLEFRKVEKPPNRNLTRGSSPPTQNFLFLFLFLLLSPPTRHSLSLRSISISRPSPQPFCLALVLPHVSADTTQRGLKPQAPTCRWPKRRCLACVQCVGKADSLQRWNDLLRPFLIANLGGFVFSTSSSSKWCPHF